jgi:hypothetical protein
MSYAIRTEAPVKDTNSYHTIKRAINAAQQHANLTGYDVQVINEDDDSLMVHVSHAYVDKYGHPHRQRTYMVQDDKEV